ncbi:anaphase-promoting complex subunit 4 isoform X3 [Eretmochelys imbricata]
MPAFRQVGEKQLPQEIIFMAWSPKRDLIALANKVGEVLLHRLANFQRVWSLPPNENTGKEVTALAWRPDGKILAFGLADTKRVILCDVEKPESLHSFSVDVPITYMHWMEVTEESSVLTSFYNAEDESNLLLPKLPALPKNYSTSAKIFSEEKSDEIMKLLGDVRLNALVLGGSSGFIEVYAYGMYKIATVIGEKNTTTSVQDEFMQLLLWGKASLELQALLMNQLTVKGLKKLGQSIESSYSSIQKLVISHLQSGSEALLYHLSELKGMASWKQKYESLGLDAAGIEDAITAVGSFILKANELLQVIDSSMKNFKAFFRWLYVAMLRMSEDHVLPELNKVMTQKDITFVADFLTEHFNEAPELYNRKGKYFNVERVGQYLKDEDDDLVSPPNTEGNQWFNFLQNSTHLKESPLLFPYYPQKSLHFVKRRMEGIIDQCLQKPADVIGKSVHQAVCMPLYKGSKSEDSTPRLFKLPFMWNDKSSNLHYVLFTMLESSLSKIYILRRHTDVSRSAANGLLAVDFGNFLNNSINESSDTSFYSCIDAHFYDDETITVVLKENVEQEGKERILAQLPLSSVYVDEDQEREFILNSSKRLDEQSDDIPTRTIFLESQWRVLENMKAQYVAVNGIRKVSCVLSSNLRHVRVFEMDVEDDGEAEEEEEEEETTQIVGGEHEELNLSAVNHSSVCGGSAELADETEEHESSLDS